MVNFSRQILVHSFTILYSYPFPIFIRIFIFSLFIYRYFFMFMIGAGNHFLSVLFIFQFYGVLCHKDSQFFWAKAINLALYDFLPLCPDKRSMSFTLRWQTYSPVFTSSNSLVFKKMLKSLVNHYFYNDKIDKNLTYCFSSNGY